MEYSSYDNLINDYTNDVATPPDIKLGISDFLINLLEPIRTKYANDLNIIEICKNAYS